MNKYFELHGFDGKSITTVFNTYSHINIDMIKDIYSDSERHMRFASPAAIPPYIQQILEMNNHVLKLNNGQGKARVLEWQEVLTKVETKLQTLLAKGREVLIAMIHDQQLLLSDIEIEFKHFNKTSLLFKLVQKPDIEKRFMDAHNKLKQLQNSLKRDDVCNFVEGFYDNRIYNYVSADDFEF
jgi:hypothetical protein